MSENLAILYTGHALDLLKSIPPSSVQCCITSPPYWNLRDYAFCQCSSDPECTKCGGTGSIQGTSHIWGGDPTCEHDWSAGERTPQSGGTGSASSKQKTNTGTQGSVQQPIMYKECLFCGAWYGSLGQETTPEQFIQHLVEIFREVKRVLRDDGTLWVVIGDSYAGSGKGAWNRSDLQKETHVPGVHGRRTVKGQSGCKPKDLIGIPWMLAFALRADDWYLRQDIIYSKLNPMPSSVTDRCVTSHEYVFLLSKSKDYYFDHYAIQEDAVTAGKNVKLGKKSFSKEQAAGANIPASGNALSETYDVKAMRNKRSVWPLTSKPFKGSHFATFPETLIEPMILAGTSTHGCCNECGMPYERQVEKTVENLSNAAIAGTEIEGKGHPSDQVREDHDIRNGPVQSVRTTGWKKSCTCTSGAVRPCTVLDPFSGAATTGMVALRNGRDYIGLEQNSDYQSIADKRLIDAGFETAVID